MRSLLVTADDDFSRHIRRVQHTTLYCIEGASELNVTFYAPSAVPEPCASAFTWSPARPHSMQAASKLYSEYMEHLDVVEAHATALN